MARKSVILKDTECAAKDKRPPSNADVYYPFKSALDLFRFRTSASYYMCWHTLHRRDFAKTLGKDVCLDGLKNLHEPLGNQKRVLDFRRDNEDFQCARLSFCPDPCYGRKTKGLVPNHDFMIHKDPGNPCRTLKDQTCDWIYERNLNFEDLQRNRFNISCQCHKERKGFAWNSKYHLCVDVDECMDKAIWDRCGSSKRCQNTVGSYQCLCRPGYLMDSQTKKCEERIKLPISKINHTLLEARHLRKMMQAENSETDCNKHLSMFRYPNTVTGRLQSRWTMESAQLALLQDASQGFALACIVAHWFCEATPVKSTKE